MLETHTAPDIRFDPTMAWLIGLVISPSHDITSRIITWHHAMTAIVDRSDDTNHPTTIATMAAIPRIEIEIGTIVIAVGDDTKSVFFRLSRELTP